MNTAQWIELLERIPREDQDALLLGVSNGQEISVQDFLRIDKSFLLARGRLGGTMDSGRVFCVPYDQLCYFIFTRPIAETRMRQIFGDLLTSLEDVPLQAAAQPDQKPAADSEKATPATEGTAPSPSDAKAQPPATLRERLRARLSGSGLGDSRGRSGSSR